MALTIWQRLRVAFRGWSRRREEEAKAAQADLLRRNASWGPAGAAPKPAPVVAVPNPSTVDIEGLQVAYLDDSGQILYFLDSVSGEVVEVRAGNQQPDAARFKRVPARTAASDLTDRRAFVATLENSPAKTALAAAVESPEFRRLIAADRTTERAWYNFRNAQATRAIESWLRSLAPP